MEKRMANGHLRVKRVVTHLVIVRSVVIFVGKVLLRENVSIGKRRGGRLLIRLVGAII